MLCSYAWLHEDRTLAWGHESWRFRFDIELTDTNEWRRLALPLGLFPSPAPSQRARRSVKNIAFMGFTPNAGSLLRLASPSSFRGSFARTRSLASHPHGETARLREMGLRVPVIYGQPIVSNRPYRVEAHAVAQVVPIAVHSLPTTRSYPPSQAAMPASTDSLHERDDTPQCPRKATHGGPRPDRGVGRLFLSLRCTARRRRPRRRRVHTTGRRCRGTLRPHGLFEHRCPAGLRREQIQRIQNRARTT